MGELEGLRTLVTGAASGIGLAVAHAFAGEGAKVAVLDRQTPPQGLLPDLALVIQADVTDDAAVRDAVRKVVEVWGGVDVVVNNAGIGAQGGVEDNPDDEWHRVLDVNVLGTMRVSRAAWPHLAVSRHAAIVTVSSIAATAGLPDRALYSASKGAVLSLTRAMAADGVPHGIRVNAVCPGTVRTPMLAGFVGGDQELLEGMGRRTPMGRLGDAGEIAEAIVWLLSDASSYVTGASVDPDGGVSAVG